MIKVLMLGWEFPPHISGGLGVACEGLTSALLASHQAQIVFVIPKAFQHVQNNGLAVLGANTISIPIKKEAASYLTTYDPAGERAHDFLMTWSSSITEDSFRPNSNFDNGRSAQSVTYRFEGGYGRNLLHEVDKYAEVIAALANERDFDVVHAHDWMTFPAAIAAKCATGKSLVIHVHSTEFYRAGSMGSPLVYEIERRAVAAADRIITVSKLTKQILIDRYDADPQRIDVVCNGATLYDTPSIPTEVHPLLVQTTRQNALKHVITISWKAAAEKVLAIYSEFVRRVELHSPSIL